MSTPYLSFERLQFAAMGNKGMFFHRVRAALDPLIGYWNWKSALMSVSVRATGYAIATAKHGWRAGVAAVLLEVIYVGSTAGFYAALQQRSLKTAPRWFGNLLIAVGVPMLAQTVDWAIHVLAGTPNLKVATLGVGVFTLLSALFHLHIMRQGAMLVGKEGRTLAEDMRSMPRLIAGFFLQPMRMVQTVGRVEMFKAAEENEIAA
jgi:hypothetical protein